jgi:DNA mismatch endonuclease (patch repair protein)
MTDVFSIKKRSQIMSRVRSQGNKATELRLVQLFRTHKITGWRRNAKLFGKPDFVFPTERVAVFVDGCFWHKCPVHGGVPRSNRTFWLKKLSSNQERDRHVARQLEASGWHVVRIWQHDLSRPASVAGRIAKMLARQYPGGQ